MQHRPKRIACGVNACRAIFKTFSLCFHRRFSLPVGGQWSVRGREAMEHIGKREMLTEASIPDVPCTRRPFYRQPTYKTKTMNHNYDRGDYNSTSEINSNNSHGANANTTPTTNSNHSHTNTTPNANTNTIDAHSHPSPPPPPQPQSLLIGAKRSCEIYGKTKGATKCWGRLLGGGTVLRPESCVCQRSDG